MDYDLPEITDEQIDAYILKRKLRKILIIVLAVVVVAVGVIILFVSNSKRAAEERLREEELAKYYASNNFIEYNGKKILVSSDLPEFLKYLHLFYGTFTVRGNRSDKTTDLKTFLKSEKCVSSNASWLGWMGTQDEPKLIEINGFIKTGDANSCYADNMRVDSFVMRSGVVKKGEYSVDIAKSTADEVMTYFDVSDEDIYSYNSSRVIYLEALSTDEYRAEFWYDDNRGGEDPIKLVYEYVEPITEPEPEPEVLPAPEPDPELEPTPESLPY